MYTYEYVDDGWYCNGYWIYKNGERFAESLNEDNARTIIDALNGLEKKSDAAI